MTLKRHGWRFLNNCSVCYFREIEETLNMLDGINLTRWSVSSLSPFLPLFSQLLSFIAFSPPEAAAALLSLQHVDDT